MSFFSFFSTFGRDHRLYSIAQQHQQQPQQPPTYQDRTIHDSFHGKRNELSEKNLERSYCMLDIIHCTYSTCMYERLHIFYSLHWCNQFFLREVRLLIIDTGRHRTYNIY